MYGYAMSHGFSQLTTDVVNGLRKIGLWLNILLFVGLVLLAAWVYRSFKRN